MVGTLPEDYLTPERAAEWRGLYERSLADGTVRLEYQTIDGRTLAVVLNRIVQDGVVTGVSVFGKGHNGPEGSRECAPGGG